jgi:hypothetical protein
MRTFSAWLRVLLVAAFLLGSLAAAAADDGVAGKRDHRDKKGAGKSAPSKSDTLPTVDEIAAKLGPDVVLTQEQKDKIQALREELLRKFAEINNREDVKAAKAELEKVRAAGDPDGVKLAQVKLKELLGGFSLTEEFRKGLTALNVLTYDQLAKLFPPAPKTKGDKGEKAGKKK